MAKYCSNCGAELAHESKFCTSCGANFEEKTVETTQTEYQTQQPSQPPVYTPMGQPPRKSNKKLMAVVAILVVAIVVIAAVVLILFVGGGGSSGNFVGTWRLDSAVLNGNITPAPVEMTFTFNSDGTYEVTAFGSPDTAGTWSASNGKLYTPNSNASTPPSMDYQFSNDKNTLTLSYSMNVGDQVYQMSLILKRVSSSSNSNSGNSHQLDEGLVGNWTLSSMVINGQNTPLNDITIDFNSDGTYKSTEYTYTNETGTWHVSNEKLFFQTSSGGSIIFYSSTTGMNYQLTDGENTLTFGYSTSYNDQTYSMNYVFERS